MLLKSKLLIATFIIMLISKLLAGPLSLVEQEETDANDSNIIFSGSDGTMDSFSQSKQRSDEEKKRLQKKILTEAMGETIDYKQSTIQSDYTKVNQENESLINQSTKNTIKEAIEDIKSPIKSLFKSEDDQDAYVNFSQDEMIETTYEQANEKVQNMSQEISMQRSTAGFSGNSSGSGAVIPSINDVQMMSGSSEFNSDNFYSKLKTGAIILFCLYLVYQVFSFILSRNKYK
ncbi:MAG: hypothetical protein HQL46_12440 [Gammaproteobacteria bacterium]|nr:hypothetical protein [Gammaproteobacteria bacterium]